MLSVWSDELKAGIDGYVKLCNGVNGGGVEFVVSVDLTPK